MYSVIVIDDEKPALEELVYLLSNYKDYDIIGQFTEPIKGIEAIKKYEPDVVFLDISMPQMNGFQVADVIMNLSYTPAIVFATAFDEYAIKAFEINATDYLLKPIITERLEITLERIKAQLNKDTNTRLQVRDTLDYVRQKYIHKIPLWKNNRIQLVCAKRIQYCTVRDGEAYIYTEDESYTTSESMNILESLLESYGFFRCHRSYLIRLEGIEEVIPWFNNTFAVKLKGINEEIPISRRRCQLFRQLLNI